MLIGKLKDLLESVIYLLIITYKVVDSDIAKSFYKCKLRHDLRSEIDSIIVNNKKRIFDTINLNEL